MSRLAEIPLGLGFRRLPQGTYHSRMLYCEARRTYRVLRLGSAKLHL